ncbi:hypothetical protein DSM104443_00688 [Usitatibacter rugosus]|uniref:DUF2950 family protein n=1 Tax=Usitatibacter rugosus TaxID=2732067 RepID=A0A6M4GQL5_9PROT|nr:DUF2950 domain-containing protein [Usitatibacter rugosus]QJR09639.1 hypothetical protein DSM104443_00688 [Usitatibacter rugosus]
MNLMRISSRILATTAAALAFGAFGAFAATPAPTQQRTFATADEAAAALAEAVRSGEGNKLLAVVGPSSKSWLFTGDEVSDRADWKRFLEGYDKKKSVKAEGDAKATLVVGDDDWPFPAPIVKKAGKWSFDVNAGKEEVINRRVGRNELDTIQVLLAVVDAQREFAQTHDGAYAKLFRSTTGKQDGLYWATKAGEKPSPLGALAAEAARDGYGGKAGGKIEPFHGYSYRILTSQGKSAQGGAYDYVAGGRMIGGFAVLAFPANYGISGVKTFIVNHDGVVYEKDLGAGTADAAAKITKFDPSKGWEKVPQ